MGLIHTPRTIYSVLNGVYKRQIFLRQQNPLPIATTATSIGTPKNTMTIGLEQTNPHLYQARLGLFDVDYLGHMNNAAYLTHAELARWELTSFNGMLQTMLRQQVHFLVVGTTIRYRKEIRPVFGRFQIDTTMCGLDERNLYMMHQFRTITPSSSPSTKKESRIMAQMVVQGVAVQNGRTVINPATFMKDTIGFDSNLIDNIMVSKMNSSGKSDDNNNNNSIIVELLDRYAALEESMKKATAEDDKKFT